MKLLLALLFTLSHPLLAEDKSDELLPFKTDYCTMFVDGNWGHCCLDHDLRYWIGGTIEEQNTSDNKLRSCVLDAAGSFWANLIFHGVRLGHHSPVKSPYQWAWGWGDDHPEFRELSKEDKARAAAEIRRSELDEEVIERFIKEHELE